MNLDLSFFAPVAAFFATAFRRRRADAASRAPVAPEARWVARLAASAAGGDWASFDQTLAAGSEAARQFGREPGARLLAHLELMRMHGAIARGRPADALAAANAAIEACAPLPAPERAPLTLQAQATAAIALPGGDSEEGLRALAGQALARAAEPCEGVVLARVVQGLLNLARLRRARGDNTGAVAALEACIVAGERHPGEEIRALALDAAVHRAQHAVEQEATDDAAGWLDRGEALLPAPVGETGRESVARLQLARVGLLHRDPIADAGPRRRRLARAHEVAAGCRSESGQQLASFAARELAGQARGEGNRAEAQAWCLRALEVLGTRQEPVSVRARLEAGLLLGQVRLEGQDLEAAADFRRVLEEAEGRQEPELREFALMAGFALLHLLLRAQMPRGADALLARMEALVDGVPAERRDDARAALALERARAAQRAVRWDEVRTQVARVLALVPPDAPVERAAARRNALVLAATAAHAEGHIDEAIRHIEAARALPVGESPDEQASGATLDWHLAALAAQSGDGARADELLRRAFERGRATGSTDGRATSARAAFQLGERAERPVEARRWLEACVALATLVGNAEGEQLARAARERLRAMPGGAA